MYKKVAGDVQLVPTQQQQLSLLPLSTQPNPTRNQTNMPAAAPAKPQAVQPGQKGES
jgi:hypothetical protein